MRIPSLFIATALALLARATLSSAAELIDSTWQHDVPREEIAPAFGFEEKGGRDSAPALRIQSGDQEGLSGQWFKVVPVEGGQSYHFSVERRCEGVPAARREVPARIVWQDDAGNPVAHEGPTVTTVLAGWKPKAEPEYPADGETDAQGWTTVSGTYRAPAAATHARLELYLQWAPRATVLWSHASFDR